MGLLFATLAGFILLVVILFYTLKLFSITLFHIPGSDIAFQFLVTIVPYAVFFAGYYYLFQKVKGDKSKAAKISGKILLVIGSLLCLISLFTALLFLFKIKSEWLQWFNDNTHYAFMIQIVMLFLCAIVIASGDPKEKNWMERKQQV